MLQPLPSDILMQLLASTAAAPSSARPGDVTQVGDDAFASALQLLLGAAPSSALDAGAAMPALADPSASAAPSPARPCDVTQVGDDAFANALQLLSGAAPSGALDACAAMPVLADPSALPIADQTRFLRTSLLGLTNGTPQVTSDLATLLMTLPTAPGSTQKTVATAGINSADQAVTTPLSPELAALIALTQGAFSPAGINGQSAPPGVTDASGASKSSGNQIIANGEATVNDPLLWSSPTAARTRPLAPQPTPISITAPVVAILSDDLSGAAQALDSAPLTQPEAQSSDLTSPTASNAPTVASTQTQRVDAEVAQAATLPAGTQVPQPSVRSEEVPVLGTFKATSKSLPTKPGNESVVDHLTAPIIPSGSDSVLAPKSFASLPNITATSAVKSDSTATPLQAKNSAVTDLSGVSPDARVLVSKMTELGLQNLSVRLGRPQSTSVDRAEALGSNQDRLATTVAPIERGSAITHIAQPSSGPSVEPTADQNRKRNERVAGPAACNAAESAQKENAGPDQSSFGRASIASKGTVTEQVESSSPVKFIVDDPKPVRVPGQITVSLQPPELGRLRIDLLEGTSGIIGRLRFTSDATRTVVERDIAQLHRSLADAGIRVERLDIIGVAPTEERSGISPQNSGEHQAAQRQTPGQGQGRHGASKDNPWYTGREGNSRHNTPWMEQRTSPWLAMTAAAQGLNLVA